MNYSLNHKIDEANFMYRVCEGVRKGLLAQVEAGGDKLECAGKLADFYAVVAPRQEKILMTYRDEGVIAHLLASLGTHIYIHLGPDENIDVFKLRDFLRAEWPEVYREVFEEKKTSYFTIAGKELTIDPSSGLLLEKVNNPQALPWDADPSAQGIPSRSRLDPLAHDRAEMDNYLRSRGVDPDVKFPLDYEPGVEGERLAFLWGHLLLSTLDMDDLWKDYDAFREWMLANGYTPGLWVYKKDSNLPLGPDNAVVTERVEPRVIYDTQAGMYLEKTGPDYSQVSSKNPFLKSLNVDFEGDTPHDKPVYLVADLPWRKQWQTMVSKRQLKKLERQNYNNMSLKRKLQFRKVGALGAKIITR